MSLIPPHKNDLNELIFVQGSFNVIEDELEPPLTDIESKFSTIEEWLVYMCTYDKPEKPIGKYNFGLFESLNEYVVTLTGVNTYEENNNSRICIEFQPEYTFFRIPTSYCGSLSREQLLKKLTNDLQNFLMTKYFRFSFFIQANIIVLEPTGQILWRK
ncbi:hypothetical protein [Pedobacter sp. N23S346]|uniref:hypothetical protein n=1 Tax=Pedobacter sp. N23S346 TaxID=3402750 RepID=UPI003AC95DC9